MASVTDPQTAVLAAKVLNVEIRLARAGLLGVDVEQGDRARLVIGPDDLEHQPEIVRFGGFAVLRVDHWAGEPVVCVPGGDSVASVYEVARRVQGAGVDPARIRAFGPPGWERVSVPLLAAPGHRVDVVPARGLNGPVIGVELT